MKKFLVRIFGIIFVLILGYQQVCYADVIDTTQEKISTISLLIGFIFVIILVVSAISYFSLKLTIKEQSSPDFDAEKWAKLTPEEIEKKEMEIQFGTYICNMIVTMGIFVWLALYNYGDLASHAETLYYVAFIAVFVLFIVSIIARSLKSRNVSNILCVIAVSITLISTIVFMILSRITGN